MGFKRLTQNDQKQAACIKMHQLATFKVKNKVWFVI